MYSRISLAVVGVATMGLSGCFGEPPQPLQFSGDEEMVLVDGGTFFMGSDHEPSQGPMRLVSVDAFFIDRTEVTVDAYLECVDAGECERPPDLDDIGLEDLDLPITSVTWHGASKYCQWVSGGSKRLPTEAEWEKAARGDDGRTYTWGHLPEPRCGQEAMFDVDVGCGSAGPVPVGSRDIDRSPWGAVDMAGNVSEWVQDWYGEYDVDDDDDPVGPQGGEHKVLRGGTFGSAEPGEFRATARQGALPGRPRADAGFRCASGELVE